MSYSEWFENHANKHKKIVQKLQKQGLSKEQIVEYFSYESMVHNEKEFCPLYIQEKKCHDMEQLNCYLCACPNFRFNDEGIEKVEEKTKYSFCAIDSQDGRVGVYGEKIHQDCSGCRVPHTKEYILKHFDYNWEKIMAKCRL